MMKKRDVVRLDITNEVWQLGEQRAIKKKKYANQIDDTPTKQLGSSLAEVLVSEYLPESLYADTPNYDILFRNWKIDVKNTLWYLPTKQFVLYEGHVPTYQQHQQTDLYFFTRVSIESRVAWLIAWMEKDAFFSHPELKQYKAGVHYSNKRRDFTHKADASELDYVYMNPIQQLLSLSPAIRSV
jgi:hypothetical protein